MANQRVQKWGTRELIEHFQTVGRPSMAQFEREWVAARAGHQERQVA